MRKELILNIHYQRSRFGNSGLKNIFFYWSLSCDLIHEHLYSWRDSITFMFFFPQAEEESRRRESCKSSVPLIDSDAELQSWRGLLNKILIVLTTKGFPSNPSLSWDDRTRCLPDSCRRIAICMYAVTVSPWCRVVVSAACHQSEDNCPDVYSFSLQ